jgi:hypothetical protein
MLASITPLGERGRGSTGAVTVTAFALGATLAGASAGALTGVLGSWLLAGVPLDTRLAALAVALGLAAALDARAPAAPGPRRQVNERWLDEYRGWVYGLGFGAQLGLGVTTVIMSAATYAALAAGALAGSAPRGALIGAVFGAVRGVTPLAAARVSAPSRLMALHRGMARWRAPSRWVSVIVLAVAATTALGAAT